MYDGNCFWQRVATVSEDLIIIGSLCKIVAAAIDKARWPMLSLVLGTKKFVWKHDASGP